MVTKRSRELEILLVAIIPGIAQAKLESSGINDRPDKPTEPITRSNKNAARGKYPDSSNSKMKKNKIKICGRKMTTPPRPASTPLMSKLRNQLLGKTSPNKPPKYSMVVLIRSMGTVAQLKTAWNMKKSKAARIIGPMMGCSNTKSNRSLKRSGMI